jgi:leucyl/phenylalanyl-tRNA--protein transferase
MRAPPLAWIGPGDPPQAFPDVRRALKDPDGLLAVGGDLSPARLLYAYRHGIFPWYHADQPILWWSPDPRAVFFPAEFHVSRSLGRRLRRGGFEIRLDTAFAEVMAACAAPRAQQPEGGTWLTAAMQAAYGELHRLGHAHSLEIWMDGALAGGVYGIALGGVFFGESMFSRVTDGSKIALACLTRHLQRLDFALLDCQVSSDHLLRLGCSLIPRAEFHTLLSIHCSKQIPADAWRGYAPPVR